MPKIGYQNGVEAARKRMRKLDPGGFNDSGTGAWDKFFNSVATLVHDHDAAIPSTPTTPPTTPPTPPAPTFKRVAPRVAYKDEGSDARYCIAGLERGSDGRYRDDVAAYDENGLCLGGRSDSPAVTSALQIDGRPYCSLPTMGDPTKNTGSWAI